MSAFNERFVGLTIEQRQDRYVRLAQAALAHYAVNDPVIIFLQHNGGIAYRIDTTGVEQHFLLKIAEPFGEGDGMRRDRLQSGLAWLAALAREVDIVVQEPIPNRRGELLSSVGFDDLDEPFSCFLQRWVDGEPVRGHYTRDHAFAVGAMTARLHQHGSEWIRTARWDARQIDGAWLESVCSDLHAVVGLGILTDDQWVTVETACKRIGGLIDRLGKGVRTWGPIHGDLHQGNLLFEAGTVHPIDFAALTVGPYLLDLGTTLYHLMYLDDAGVRQSLLAGYRSIDPDVPIPERGIEAFVCAAALGNLAFQVTIPRERESPLFQRNVREFANVFCQKLVIRQEFAIT